MTSSSQSNDLRAALVAGLEAGDSDAVLSVFDALLQMHGTLSVQHDTLAVQHDVLARERATHANVIERKDFLIRHLQRLLYGRSSEKLSRDDIRQMLLLYGASEQQAAAPDAQLVVGVVADTEPQEGPVEPPPERKRKTRRHPGRTKLSANLERIVCDVPVPEDQRNCLLCGTEMTCIRHVEHERVEYVPAKFVVHVERREVRVCKVGPCRGDAATAERAETPVMKTRVAASVLAHLIESKCDDALPIHRQCDQFARLGFEIPVNTLYGYWKYATDLLEPVSDALLGTVLDDPHYVGIDDTRLDVLDPTRPSGKYRGHLWCFRGSRELVAYAFTQTWKASEIEPWIHAIPPDVHIQVDDYKGYLANTEYLDGTVGPLVPPHRRLGCMMHVRRRFHEALKLGDKRAGFAVEVIRRLYEIEAGQRDSTPEQRLAARTEHSLPLLTTFDHWIDEQEAKLGNSGKLAEAVGYAKQQREFIWRCFTDGHFEIDNGRVERAIREPAIGRKNFLFTGSAAAAARIASAYGLVQSCRALGISTRDYLIDVLTKIESGWPARRLVELLPHNWAAARNADSNAR